MVTPGVRIVGKVTAASATAVTITPGVDTMDRGGVGSLTTVVLNGTGLTGFRVGEPLAVRVTTA